MRENMDFSLLADMDENLLIIDTIEEKVNDWKLTPSAC